MLMYVCLILVSVQLFGCMKNFIRLPSIPVDSFDQNKQNHSKSPNHIGSMLRVYIKYICQFRHNSSHLIFVNSYFEEFRKRMVNNLVIMFLSPPYKIMRVFRLSTYGSRSAVERMAIENNKPTKNATSLLQR